MRTFHTLYLSGPMTGLKHFNYPAFQAAAAQLRQAGYTVVCPTENGVPSTAPWAQHLRVDLVNLLRHCTAVATLPGASASKGATLELTVARSLAMPIHTVEAWLTTATTGPSLRGGRVQKKRGVAA